MKKLLLFAVACATLVIGTACGDEKKPAAPSAPDVVTKVLLETTKGNITLEVHSAWAPKGAARFLELVKQGYFDDCAFFRVIAGFMAQTGINADPKKTREWKDLAIADDLMVPGISNRRGYVTFALGGPNTRTTQFFINYGDNSRLDDNKGNGNFAPFAFVSQGMDVADKLYSGYGDGPPTGRGPSQPTASSLGNTYFKHDFPELDYIKKATIQ